MNLHSRICASLAISEEDNFILMYKTHFIRDPPHIAWIMYSVDHEKFVVLIYNMVAQKMSKIEISIDFTERFLPFVRIGLKNQEFLNLGRRLFKSLKNCLITEYANMAGWNQVSGRVGDFGETLE